MSLFVDIKKDFGSFKLDCKFETNGGILGFLGASGSGKSMTLRCISGLETPDDGKIILNGRTLFDKEKKINLPPQERKVGYLFQNYALFPNMTVERNILCGLYWEKDKAKKKKLVQEIIQKLQLSGLEKHRPSQLSGGQQQRTALGRILVNQPEILLLDDPFSALDAYLRGQLLTEMKALLKEYGKETILVSHNRDEIYQLCDDLAIVDQGNISGTDPVKKLFASAKTRQGALLTGCKNIVDARKIAEDKVEVPAWGVTFTTAEPVENDLVAIGIRAHYFNPKTKFNAYPVELVEAIEEPFEWTLKFRYKDAKEDSKLICWRLTKEKRTKDFPEQLGISPQNIMLLYK